MSSVADFPLQFTPIEALGVRLGYIDFKHPFFAPFADPRFSDFTHIRFWSPWEIAGPDSSDGHVFARFENGATAAMDLPIEAGSLVIWGSGWDPEQSQWPLSSKFVPWLHQLVLRAAGGEPPPNNLLATRTEAALSIAAGSWRSVGSNEALTPDHIAPGLYRRDVAGKKDWLALQLPPAESLSSPLSEKNWQDLGIPAFSAQSLNTLESRIVEQARAASDQETEARQSIWRWALALVALLLAAESILVVFHQHRSDQEGVAA